MKKALSLLLIVLMLFGLCACGKTEAPEVSTTEYTAAYLSDESVLVIIKESDIDESKIKSHYDDGGIVLVKNWELASKVQEIIETTLVIDFSAEDSAVIFHLNADGTPGLFVTGGNSTTLEMDIDDLIEEAKSRQ